MSFDFGDAYAAETKMMGKKGKMRTKAKNGDSEVAVGEMKTKKMNAVRLKSGMWKECSYEGVKPVGSWVCNGRNRPINE